MSSKNKSKTDDSISSLDYQFTADRADAKSETCVEKGETCDEFSTTVGNAVMSEDTSVSLIKEYI